MHFRFTLGIFLKSCASGFVHRARMFTKRVFHSSLLTTSLIAIHIVSSYAIIIKPDTKNYEKFKTQTQ